MSRGNSKPLNDLTNIESKSFYKIIQHNHKTLRTRNKESYSHFIASEFLLSKAKKEQKNSNRNSIGSSLEFSASEEGSVKKIPEYSCRLSGKKEPSNSFVYII
jgi:hypothetical protein